MTNPTNPFNWQMPTASDLVTDLPADFETFGQAVATSMADLLGGTTGQVLSKASNTDMDFTWVAQDDSNAIQNAIVDAKGDLIAATAADTPARLAVGNNGETLVADSSTSTGLRYTAGTVQANPILNSAFQIAQRGTSISIAANTRAYTLDRWDALTNPSQACTVSRQATGDTTNLPFIQYAARFQRNSGQTGTGVVYFANSFETINSLPFAGKTVTFSFYARAGANFSSSGNALSASVATGTGTDQAILTGYTGTATPITVNATLTTTWQRFTGTAALSSSLNEMCLYFNYAPTGTAGTNDYFEVTGVQIDIGSVALPFRTYAGTLQGELAACQRYYYRQTTTTNYGNLHGVGVEVAATSGWFNHFAATTMRTKPSSVDYSALKVSNATTSFAITALSLNANNADGSFFMTDWTSASGGTANRPCIIQANNNSAAYIGFSAEL
jgi:hypothetical protein